MNSFLISFNAHFQFVSVLNCVRGKILFFKIKFETKDKNGTNNVLQMIFTGAISILPTVLYLTTCCIKETASKAFINSKFANNSAVSACLHLLRYFSCHKYCTDSRSADQWQSLLQSTLAKLIDMAKTG